MADKFLLTYYSDSQRCPHAGTDRCPTCAREHFILQGYSKRDVSPEGQFEGGDPNVEEMKGLIQAMKGKEEIYKIQIARLEARIEGMTYFIREFAEVVKESK